MRRSRANRLKKRTMKKSETRTASCLRLRSSILIVLLLILFQQHSALALPLSDSAGAIPAEAMKLVQFCADPKTGLDTQALATLVDYVLAPKADKEAALSTLQKATGAYYEFDTKINFQTFLQYSYSNQIPSVLTSPASLRYTLWTDLQGETQKLPVVWKLVPPNGKPVVIRGIERVCITPDLTTGVYYEYDLKRTLILLNYKERQVLISISKQKNISDIGKKGFILGNDDDWNYYYSGEPGSAKTGLGWVKSYIYDYFSVGVYVESDASSSLVRSGVFQWIRAGWSGINFVEPKHVIKGMKRYAKSSKTVLESPKLPTQNKIVSTYQQLTALNPNHLTEKYNALQQARQSLAIQSGKIKTTEINKQPLHATTSKKQIIEELMLEYFKIALGKSLLLGGKSPLAFSGSLAPSY